MRLAAGYEEHNVRVGKPARLGADGRWSYDWDERLRLGRDKALTVQFGVDGFATGVLVSRAHAAATLRAADGDLVRVRERDIWSVRPA